MALNKTRPSELTALLGRKPSGLRSEVRVRNEYYNPGLRATGSGRDTEIGLYGIIGEDWTAALMDAVLRGSGGSDVVVNINSPGGDVFEGLAIYNLLRAHEAKVTVNVIGIAASAASFIAMAADEIRIGRSAYMMIHNAWSWGAGDKNDLRELADWLDKADSILNRIYADRTGNDSAVIAAAMDAETYMTGEEAVSAKYADGFLDTDGGSVQNRIVTATRADTDSESARFLVNLINSIK